MVNSLHKVTAELRIELVIGYGSSFTGKKRGMSERRDTDLVIVSDFFRSMSMSKRKEIVIEKLGKKIDPVPLTTQEYKKLRKNKDSLVNTALKEGRILYDAEKQSLGGARKQI
jgi:stress-induced morphogen